MYFNHTRIKHQGQGWDNRDYLKFYKISFKYFIELNNLNLFEQLKNRLYRNFQNQQYLPKAENFGKFCVTCTNKVFFLDMYL